MRKIRVKNYEDIFIGEYPFHKQLKDELVPLLEKYDDRQNRKTNVKATMTEWNWDPKNDRLKRLKNNIIEFANYNCYYYNSDGKSITYFMKSFWGNIYRKGDCARPHMHKPEVLSCVYFLKTKWYHSPLVFTDSEKKLRHKKISPKEGTFVIFPSHLFHLVPEHRYRETRITLSGNMRINQGVFSN